MRVGVRVGVGACGDGQRRDHVIKFASLACHELASLVDAAGQPRRISQLTSLVDAAARSCGA